MRYTIRHISPVAILLTIGTILFASCEKSIHTGPVNEDPYDASRHVYMYARNYNNPQSNHVVELSDSLTSVQMEIGLTKSHSRDMNIQFSIDPTVLERYNELHSTSFGMYPTDHIFPKGTNEVFIPAGETHIDPVIMQIQKDTTLQKGKTYAIPIALKSSEDSVFVSGKTGGIIWLVQVLDSIQSAEKSTGIKTICYFEIRGGGNPLNAGIWRLKNSGKPLIDIVHLFSVGLCYDSLERKAYLKPYAAVGHILNNHEKYIKPLQKLGIKVCMDIIPMKGADGVGVANLPDDVAVNIAREVRAYVDAYGLDGVDFDDEYVKYENKPKGYPDASGKHYSRLVYECRKIMPDKIVTVYDIGNTSGFLSYDGLNPGDYINYSYQAYYGQWDSYSYSKYKGMTKKQWGPYAVNIESGDADTYYLKKLRAEGFGVLILYNMMPKDYTDKLKNIAKELYDDEIYMYHPPYERDW